MFVPLKTKIIPDSSCPWFSTRIRNTISRRDAAYKRWKRFRLTSIYDEYKTLRNQVVLLVKKAKSQYYSSKLDCRQSTKKLWNNLNQIGIGELNRGSFLDIQPDDFNRTFAGGPSSSVSYNGSYDFPDSSRDNEFFFRGVGVDEVATAVLSVKSSAVGLDGIHPKFVRMILPAILPCISHVFNSIFTKCYFPLKWKEAKVIPVAKKSRPNAVSDFRPISILPFFSKVMERLMHNQMFAYISRNNLLSEYQSGFRPKHSCVTALLKISDDIRGAIDLDLVTILVLLDFSKAFDTVDHMILISKLASQFMFSSYAVRLLGSYLMTRRQKTLVNGKSSDFLGLKSGVPQGSILGPLLFSCFINDCIEVMKNVTPHLYADDLQIYLSRRLGLVDDLVARINEDLENVVNWSNSNKLLLNLPKTCAIAIYKNDIVGIGLPSIIVDGSIVPYSKSVRNLGVIFNSTLSWSDHVKSTISKIYFVLRKLSVSASFVPQQTRCLLVKTLVLPLISHASNIFSRLDSVSSSGLRVAFNSAVRYAFRLTRYEHVSSNVDLILGCKSLALFIDMRMLIFLQGLLNSREPKYLFEKIVFCHTSRALTLVQPRFSNLSSERQFFVHVTRLWNSLPFEIRRAVYQNNFASKLKSYYKNK